MYEEIDVERLRKDLLDYYGTAMYNASPLAIIELSKIERASEDELIQIAINNNINLNEYINNQRYR